jgi:hypothetical protein
VFVGVCVGVILGVLVGLGVYVGVGVAEGHNPLSITFTNSPLNLDGGDGKLSAHK